jgi:hypothetical protein
MNIDGGSQEERKRRKKNTLFPTVFSYDLRGERNQQYCVDKDHLKVLKNSIIMCKRKHQNLRVTNPVPSFTKCVSNRGYTFDILTTTTINDVLWRGQAGHVVAFAGGLLLWSQLRQF